MKSVFKNFDFSRFDLSTIILLVCQFVFVSCEEPDSKRKIFISGKLIDSTNKSQFNNINMSFRSIIGSKEDALGETKVNSNGEFSFTYFAEENLVNSYLRVEFDTTFYARDKFRFLPLGESWNKVFFIGDSATIFIKLSNDLKETDTLYLSTPLTILEFSGPTHNQELGNLRIVNYTGSQENYKYGIGKNSFFNDYKIIKTSLTGDPIIDTLTLDINP